MGFLSRIFRRGTPDDAPERFGIAELARRLGITEDALRSTPVRYHTFTIPKRSGKPRPIAAPAPELKQLQRLILRRLLRKLNAHSAATGFERGHSIVTHARHHAAQRVIIRIDIQNYFDTTRKQRIYTYFRKIGWDRAAADLLTNICTLKGALPQGAPTSPRLSNLVNRELDIRLQRLADTLGARYSRYADDLAFSFTDDNQERIHSLLRCVRLALEDVGYTMHMKRKLHIRRRHQRQTITGLTVNDTPNLPRSTRRWLRAVQHRLATRGSATLTQSQLAGWHALRNMIDSQRQHKP